MKQALSIVLMAYLCFLTENILFQMVGPWFRPDLLLLLVVFFNLFKGIRYSLFTAFAAGFLRDSFTSDVFGLNIFSLVMTAYLLTFIKMYLYQPGSSPSRILMVVTALVIYTFLYYAINSMFVMIPWNDMFMHLFLPQLIVTGLATTYIFKQFRQCVSRLFV